jgi:UDP:flavonoid glycosyltransferase YjiC (YdhE family)
VPARILLTCWGSAGDLFPYLALAIRLRDLGHQPVVAAPAYYRALVEQERVIFHAVRPDLDPSDVETIKRVMDPAHGTKVILSELLGPRIAESVEDLRAAAHGVDLIISHPVTFGAPIVAEMTRTPWLSTVLAPTSLFSIHDFPLLPPYPAALRVLRASPWIARGFMLLARRITAPWTASIRTFRADVRQRTGGDPLYDEQFSPYGTLALFSPRFGPPQRDWPVNTTATGFVFLDGPSGLIPALQDFLDHGDPPVVFTLGTSAVGAAGSFFAASAEAAAALGRRAVLLVGSDPRNLPAHLPPTILAVAYAPHAALFPRAAAVVHHGGIGTTAQALRAGRPMLVVPHAHDQPDNAFRARRLGVALDLDARRYTAGRALRKLRELLSVPRYRVRAAAVGAAIRAEDGTGVACRIIQQALTDFRNGQNGPPR